MATREPACSLGAKRDVLEQSKSKQKEDGGRSMEAELGEWLSGLSREVRWQPYLSSTCPKTLIKNVNCLRKVLCSAIAVMNVPKHTRHFNLLTANGVGDNSV